MAVKSAILNGEVDAIASHHLPQNYDNKICEFEYAKNGMIGLESLFGVLGKTLITGDNGWTIEKLVTLLTLGPRKIMGIAPPEIKEGATAVLSLFNPTTEYLFVESMIGSKSKNTPFIGLPLKGKVIGIINGDKSYFN